jgi:NADH:ubiquinone oxidoreductase subunit E
MQSQAGFKLEASLDELREAVDKYKDLPGSTIPILQDIQEICGYLPEEAVEWAADRLSIPQSQFFGVATFYSQFYLTPRGKNIVTVCSGTACHVKGSEKIINRLTRDLNLAPGQNTTDDFNFTLEKVNCVGACSIAPVVIINSKVNGKASASKIAAQVKKLASVEDQA